MDRETFAQIASELERLQRQVQHIRELPASQMLQVLELRTRWSRDHANRLIQRIVELREIIEIRRRRLEQLRARMRQIRGGAKPH